MNIVQVILCAALIPAAILLWLAVIAAVAGEVDTWLRRDDADDSHIDYYV